MLEVVGASLISFLMNILGQEPAQMETARLLAWQEADLFSLTDPDPQAEQNLEQYLKTLTERGANPNSQGVWMESGWKLLLDRQGTIPLSAASLTKIATTLAALHKWGHEYQFETLIHTTGEIENGVLQGDLIIEGGGDPFFVWEEAIALGNVLNEMGIREVAGNLVIVGDFYMNYYPNPQIGGESLKVAFDEASWNRDATYSYSLMPVGSKRPNLKIAGNVVIQESLAEVEQSSLANLLLRHQSVSLAQILKQMNIYSNNAMAEVLAESVGGAEEVAQLAAELANVPQKEIQLINGSGLGVDNRISPRAVCAMLLAIEEKLEPQPLTIFDLFPVAGRDKLGTVIGREIPTGTAFKTGTLNQVSALAGIFPTRDRGMVAFAIINNGNIGPIAFRDQQDWLLQKLAQNWGTAPIPDPSVASGEEFLGNPQRNLR
ncbi:MAG: D-alanyl-D-alanine carboxypeptidase [Spirulinaceae cyanobacterium]